MIGKKELINTYGIAIVGSRKCSNEGKNIARLFAKELSKQGLTIISGLAKGIDTAAHEGALEIGGNTIAVLGNGFNCLFPESNEKLYKEIFKKGLVISEYDKNEEAKPKYFLERNRIVSGVSIGILVIEARYRSGTISTATLARKQGKEVFCTPHAINNKCGLGNNYLITKGAKLVTSVKEIMDEFPYLKYKGK